MGAPAPQLAHRLYEAVSDLSSELIVETYGRGLFSAATPEDLLLPAGTFARYRLTTLPIATQSDLVERHMFLQGIRELRRISFREMHLVAHPLPHFAPPGGPFSRQCEGPSS